jgi:hypothetical protein
MDPTLWIVDVGDPASRGLLSSVLSETSQLQPDLIRRDGRLRGLRFVKRNESNAGSLFNDVSFDAASVIEFAIGTPDAPPTSGTFSLSYNGDSTGLTGLLFSITATDLATALNANPAVSSAGGVTVTKASLGGQWLVAFNTAGARFTFAITDNTLQPPSNEGVAVVVEGDGSTNEVQLIAIRQGYLAYNDVWAIDSSGALTLSVVQSGTASQPSIQRVSISDTVKGGVWSLMALQAQIVQASVSSNEATSTSITFDTTGVVGGINSMYVDFSDATGPVRMWVDIGGTGTPPSTPTGGRLLEVDATTASATAVGLGIYNAISGDAAFTDFTLSGNGVIITFSMATPGPISATVTATGTGITHTSTAGNAGRLDQTSFIAYDQDGPVGVWVNLSSVATPPAVLAAVGRIIQVTGIAAGATASTAATAIAAAIDPDANFVASAASGIVTITNTFPGSRTAPVQNSALIGVTQTQPGYALSGAFGIHAGPGDVQAVFGDIYNVTKSDEFTWEFVALQNGTQATITGNDTGLIFAEIFTGNVDLNNWNMLLAFNAVTTDSIESTLEIQVTEPGQLPVKVLNIPVTIRRDVIDVASVVSPTPTSDVGNVFFLGSVTGYTGGGSTNLDGVATTTLGVPRLVQFVHTTDGLRSFMLRAGTDAEDVDLIIRPDDYNGASNAKVYQSVA